MRIIVTIPQQHNTQVTLSFALIPFALLLLIAFALATLLVGWLLQIGALISPALITGGWTLLQFAMVSFLAYRGILWMWRLSKVALRHMNVQSYLNKVKATSLVLLRLVGCLLFR